MLNLSTTLTLDKDTIESPNLCDRFTEQDLKSIATAVHDAFLSDVQSREGWVRRTEAAMDLAMQIQKDKNFPWPNCSNIAFPLVTVAAFQFHSRAYPALLPGDDLVKCRVIGPDPDGKKTERAEKVGNYMSWQLTEQDSCWEEQEDRALINVPIVGTAFKKSYFSSEKNHNVSELVLARDLVLNYWATSVESCPTKTHVIPLSRNQVFSRISSRLFRDIREEAWYKDYAQQPSTTYSKSEQDNRAGLTPPQSNAQTPFTFLEQHCSFDLDGDGYEEPYIITIEQSSLSLVRIVCRFSEEDILRDDKGNLIQIRAEEYFTKIPFIPSPDGGIMDIGFGVLLGPLNESVNTAINQLFDAGTINNTAGGFLGRGAKIRGGVYSFSPFEWNRVDSTGDDLRKSVIPLPTREPSNVMFQLLTLLIEYTEKISGAVDIITGGNPGQNTPAQTSQTMVEQGQKVYSAIFKRIWRSMKEEFQKLYVLNGKYLSSEAVYYGGSSSYVTKADFQNTPDAIAPVADKNILSDSQKFVQASALMNIGKNNPLYDQDVLNKRFLSALKVTDIETLYIGTEKAPKPGPSEKIQIEMLKVQIQQSNLEWKKLQYISSLLEQRKLNEAKIISLYAEAALAEKQAGGVEAGNQIAAFQARIDAIKMVNDMMGQQINSMGGSNGAQQPAGSTDQGDAGGGEGTIPAMAGASSDGNGNAMGIPQAGGP